jgi:glycosyltransferase involved in cell wall biosynthesis
VNVCLLIPIYNHADTIGHVLRSLAYLELPCLVVDDGSDVPTRSALDEAVRECPWVTVERLPENRGRGAALRCGYRTAWGRGFSHVVQLDADGQHEPRDVPRFLEIAQQRPDALVLGAPIFDATAPLNRLIGRQLSRFWVHVETRSLAIEDPLCGFRCLPLRSTVDLLSRAPLGDRMEFDPEIAVRWLWEGLPVINLPTRVKYFPHGLSHFRPWDDNARITWAHTRLVFGMLWRLVGGSARAGTAQP